MTTKEKILAALDCALEDLSDDRLLDILLDAYESKKKAIKDAEARWAEMRFDREQLRADVHRMRTDPLCYTVAGQYHFREGNRKFCVVINGRDLTMYERRGIVDYSMPQITGAEFYGKD